MSDLAKNWRTGDKLFVSNGALPAFLFYKDRYGLGSVAYQTYQESDYSSPENILQKLKLLDGYPRVWILITHVYEKGNFNEKDYLLSCLDLLGGKKREFRHPGTLVYLYLYDLGR